MYKEFLSFLPIRIFLKLKNVDRLEEIRLRIGKKVDLRYIDEEVFLNEIITKLDIEEILENICKNSVYSYQNEIVNGFITIEGGHRVGITGSCVVEKGKIVNICNITSLNIRIAKQIKDVSRFLDMYIVKEDAILNTLIVSPPGMGKTTILKDLIRRISNGDGFKSLNVSVVDERLELSANFDGTIQIDLGEKTDIITNICKDKGMKMLIRSMAPEVIVVDEIGTKEDVEAIKYAVTSGVKGIFTAHGDSFDNILLNPILKELINTGLIERLIFLSKVKKGCLDKVYENTKEGYKLMC